MADNVAITAGSGTTIAADEVSDGTLGSVKVQYVKIMDGTLDGTTKATVNSNGLKVDGSAVTQPVSAASLPLPSGASTAAKQPALGTAGTASADVITVQGVASMTALKVDGSAVTQPVSAASLPLPALAATSTKQSDGSQKTQVVDGSGNVIGSTSNALDVNIKSGNPTTIATTVTDVAPATQNITVVDSGSSTTAGANSQSIITGSPTANSAASFAISGQDTIIVQVSGTWTGTLQAEISQDSGTTWYIRGVHQAGTSYTAAAFTANFAGGLNIGGYTNFRIRATAAMTGTATVKVTESQNLNSIYVANSIKISDPTTPSQQLGVDSSGRISVNAGTNLNTSALAVESGGNLALIAASASVMDDWDESDRAKVNLIAGQAGVSAGVGASDATTQRVVNANGAGKTILSTGGSASSSGNNTLVAAGTNKLKVFAFSLTTTSTTAMTCIFQSGAGGTELWRVLIQAPSGANSGANLTVTPPAWLFATASATLLNLNLSSANAVHWSVSYYDEV